MNITIDLHPVLAALLILATVYLVVKIINRANPNSED